MPILQQPKVWVPDGTGEKVIADAPSGDLSDDGKKLVLKSVRWVIEEADRKGYLLSQCRVQEARGAWNKYCKMTELGATVIKFDVK